MSKNKLRVKNTQPDNLISNLRSEVGEIVTSWVLLRHFMEQDRQLRSGDIAADFKNKNLIFLTMLRMKLDDEIVARLSELAEEKIGRLTFHFASIKLSKLAAETRAFQKFVKREKFQQKRNQDISHKELPERWAKHGPIHIPYRTLLRGVGYALRLMKKFDRALLGPSAKYVWPAMRKKRYELMAPASAAYTLVPYMNLTPEIRRRVILEEMAEGREIWSEMPATVNGQKVTVSACREWGAVMFYGRMIVLPQYPLQSIEFTVPVSEGDAEPETTLWQPVTEQKLITARYRLTKKEDDKRMSFAPVQRVHRLDAGTLTELVDFDIILDDTFRLEFGSMNVGDQKDFSLTVNVLTGLQPPPGASPLPAGA